MIEFFALLIIIIAFVYLLYPIVTIPTFLINVSLFIIIALRARIDLKENKMHIYYLWASFLTVILFVAKEYGFMARISDFLFGNKILLYTQAVIAIFIIAHLIGLIHSTVNSFIKDMKKAKKE
jgi:hypothetical protein